jgi:hypothetical protein
LFGECVCIHCFGCSLVSTFNRWNPDFITCYSYKCDWEIHCHLCGNTLKKSTKADAILWVLCAPVSIFGTHLVQNVW